MRSFVKLTIACAKVFLEMYYKGPVHSELAKYMTGKKLYKKVKAQEKKEEERKEEREDEIRINSVTFATALRMALAAQQVSVRIAGVCAQEIGRMEGCHFYGRA